MDTKTIRALANGQEGVWKSRLDVRKDNPVFKRQKMLMRAFEKALIELEMAWVRKELGNSLAQGSIKIVLSDEKGQKLVCQPTFTAEDKNDETA